MRKLLYVVLAIAALGGGGYAYYQYKQRPVAPTISTGRVTRGDIVEAVAATGALQAVTTVQVGSQVSGIIRELHADFNSLVKKGQVLARLDPSLFETQIEQARANLIRAQADLERLRVGLDDARTKLKRARELSAMKLIPQTELETAEVTVRAAEAQLRSQEAAVTQSQASLQQNQVNLQHTVIESPIDGLVISRNVDVGQTVAASMSAPTLFVLAADLTKMQVLASLDESDVGRIRPGQAVRFRVDAYPTDEFAGSVTQVRLQPTTVQNVVTYQTVIDVPNPELKLKPGMTANVSIEIARKQNVIRIPNTALRFRPTAEMFTALGQTPPPNLGGGGGGRGRGIGAGPDTRLPQSEPAPVAQQQPQPASPELRGGGAERREGGPAPPAAPAQRRAAAQSEPQRQAPREQPAADASAEADGATAGRGGGSARRGGGSFADRLASMTPEERERAMQRMRARGFTPPSETQADAGARGGGAPRVRQRNESQPARAVQTAAGQGSSATTFDALFGPLAPTQTVGQVWLNDGGKLQRVRVRLGISDGQQTELLQAVDGNVQEGTEVVTNVVTGAVRQTPTAPGGNAFPGMGPQRGFAGGGRRGG